MEVAREMAESMRPTPDPLAGAQLQAVSSEVASVLRHELRNKFASVRNAAFYVRRRLKDCELWRSDPLLEEMSQIIQNEMRLANELLDQQLQLPHVFVRAVAELNAEDCVHRAVSCTRVPAESSVEIRVDARPGQVLADATDLTLAIRCLVENAVEAAPAGSAVQVRAAPEAERYRIEVSDPGSGIPESEREAVFEGFHTTKPGHAGLGLNIARRVAERYQGALCFRDGSAGSVVVLEIKLCPTDTPSA